MREWNTEIYNVPAYSVSDAARYLHIPLPTLRSWLQGRTYQTKTGQRTCEPIIQRPSADTAQMSFINLIEAHVLRILREIHQIKLDKVRIALDYMSKAFDSSHPLAEKRFQTDGVDLFVDRMDGLVNVSRSGQLAMKEILKHLLTRVEWDERDIATRLFPFVRSEGDNTKILYIDPRISFGKPVIAGTRIPSSSIIDLYDAGDEIEDIADEFDCTPQQIKAAIQFESSAA